MAKDYIEYSKKERYKEQLEYLAKFNLTSHNVNRFEDKIEAIVTSIDTEIRSSMSYVNELQNEINNRTKKPELKSLVDDPWYKIFQIQENLVKYLIRAGGFKTWLIKFLVTSNNKFSEFVDAINENLVELKKIEMQRDMYEKMYNNLEEIRKNQEGQQNFIQSQEYENQVKRLQQQLEGQREVMENMAGQVSKFKSMIHDLENRQSQIKRKRQQLEEEQNNQKPKLKQPGHEGSAEVMTVDTNKSWGEVMAEDDEFDEDDQADEVYDEEQPDEVYEKKTKNDVNDGIEFDNFEEEIEFFKSFSEDLDFKVDKEGEIKLIIETAEDLKRQLGLDPDDYSEKEDQEKLVGRLAFQYTNYVYTKQALMDFFGVSKYQFPWILKGAGEGVEDHIIWEDDD